MAQFAAEAGDDPDFTALNAARKVVISRTLKDPFGLDNTRSWRRTRSKPFRA